MSGQDSELPVIDAPGAEEQQDENDEGFDDGFAKPNAPTETPGMEQVQAAEEPDAPRQPTMEERLASAEALIESLKTSQEKGLGTAFGKIGGIERNLGKAGVPIDQTDIDALRGDGFESHARALEKIRDLQIVRTGATLGDDDKAELRVSIKRELQIEAVDDAHPDWRDQVLTPEFQAWKAKQSTADQQRLDNDWNANFITKKLTEFKASRQKPAPTPTADANPSTRKGRLAAAVTPRGTGSTPSANTDDEFDAGFKTGRST
jgi:hypothetical protein